MLTHSHAIILMAFAVFFALKYRHAKVRYKGCKVEG
jgi:hypothetical protein